MNDQPSSSTQNDNEQPSSPKRKRVRQKYAPKACVSCRRSKLKCSGHNPCQRCRDNDRRCFFSEDQTAAEALQNLSRPSLAQQPSSATSNGNTGGPSLRSTVSRPRTNERPVSDAGAASLSMEARMARIEAMMEALLQERAMYAMHNSTMEHDNSSGDISMSISTPNLSNPTLPLISQSPHMFPPQGDAIDPLLDTSLSSIQVGSQSFALPVPAAYQNFINTFFRDIHIYYPCIDERLFRSRSAKMLSETAIDPHNACFLALNYIVFALHAACTEVVRATPDDTLSGWHWLQLADDVIGTRQLYGQGDISLAQFLLFKAVYYTLVDKPSLAYNTIGLASRFALQQGLNRQSSLPGTEAWESFERLRVFWNILIVDRRISLSCGRPYTIRDSDVDVERPRDLHRRSMGTGQHLSQLHTQLPEADDRGAFLSCMIDWSRFAGSLWDSLLATHLSTDILAERVTTFDEAIADFLENSFLASEAEIQPPQLHPFICMSFDNLRLLARRTTATYLHADHGTVSCSRVAIDTIKHIQAYQAATNYSLTCSFRHNIMPALASSLLSLCSFLISDLGRLEQNPDKWLPPVHEAFDTAVSILHNLAQEMSLARRVLDDFNKILPVVQAILARWSTETQLVQGSLGWDIVKDVIPLNATELLPYQDHMPDISCPALHDGMWASSGSTDRSLSGWYDYGGGGGGGAGSSVLWI